MRAEIILQTEDLTKDFAGFVAVSGVNLQVARGTIHALIGPNGAGKTTCFNLLTKFLKPTHGSIVYKGEDITALAPADVARLGLVRSFQISAVFPHLTVLENVRIALQRKRGGSFDFWRSSRILDDLNDRALALIADVGLAPLRAPLQSSCLMAASGHWNSPPRSRSIPRCCCLTSPPPAWGMRTSTASRRSSRRSRSTEPS